MYQTMNKNNKLLALQVFCIDYAKGGKDSEEEILHLLDDPEIRSLPYLQRNKLFLTSSKLKAFKECPYHAKMQYVDGIDHGKQEEDYFVIGNAVDDYLTHGDSYFHDRYEVVSRRSEGASKKQLTKSSGEVVENCVYEYGSRAFFPQKLVKKNVIWLMHGMVCKAELDHLDIENRRIEDTKTCANIATFDPRNYLLQMGFYSFGINKRYGDQVEAALNVVDKHSGWSRSHKWILSRHILQEQHYEIERLVRQWKACVESGIWPHCDMDTEEGRKIAWNSPYYAKHCSLCKSASPSIL